MSAQFEEKAREIVAPILGSAFSKAPCPGCTTYVCAKDLGNQLADAISAALVSAYEMGLSKELGRSREIMATIKARRKDALADLNDHSKDGGSAEDYLRGVLAGIQTAYWEFERKMPAHVAGSGDDGCQASSIAKGEGSPEPAVPLQLDRSAEAYTGPHGDHLRKRALEHAESPLSRDLAIAAGWVDALNQRLQQAERKIEEADFPADTATAEPRASDSAWDRNFPGGYKMFSDG